MQARKSTVPTGIDQLLELLNGVNVESRVAPVRVLANYNEREKKRGDIISDKIH
jgi:hypothetical protein